MSVHLETESVRNSQYLMRVAESNFTGFALTSTAADAPRDAMPRMQKDRMRTILIGRGLSVVLVVVFVVVFFMLRSWWPALLEGLPLL